MKIKDFLSPITILTVVFVVAVGAVIGLGFWSFNGSGVVRDVSMNIALAVLLMFFAYVNVLNEDSSFVQMAQGFLLKLSKTLLAVVALLVVGFIAYLQLGKPEGILELESISVPLALLVAWAGVSIIDFAVVGGINFAVQRRFTWPFILQVVPFVLGLLVTQMGMRELLYGGLEDTLFLTLASVVALVVLVGLRALFVYLTAPKMVEPGSTSG